MTSSAGPRSNGMSLLVGWGLSPYGKFSGLGTVGRMNNHQVIQKSGPTRSRIIQVLNDELANELQAIIAFIVYSQMIEKSGYAEIARELERHAAGDFQHIKQLAKQIENLGGIPRVTWMADKATGKPGAQRNVAPDYESATIGSHVYRLPGAAQIREALSSTALREIIVEDLAPINLAAALGIASAPAKRVRAKANRLKPIRPNGSGLKTCAH